ARGGKPTKMWWDWSTAGKLKDGKPFKVKDATGHDAYDSKKGDFKLGENVVPDYVWFNGQVKYTTQDMKIDPEQVLRINEFLGGPDDPQARIWPVKRFEGRQPYDKVHLQLLVPHTATPDDTAFWFNFDWPKALQAGAAATGQSYSGQHGFVKTEMLWPITHMVAPAAETVACASCHTGASQSRLGELPGFYLPGRDRHRWIDTLGWLAVTGVLAGVLVHAGARLLNHARQGKGH
ncbi:MAG: cytochrome C, partial [Burkholderiales bacterium]